MISIASRGRKTLAALIAASTLGLAVAPGTATAGWHGHHGYGYGAAAFGGGLLLGALALNAASEREVYERDCWSERRRFVNVYGDVFYRHIRVCD